MEQQKLSITKAAKIAKVSVSTIAGWKTGTSSTDYEAVKRLATHLGVTLDYILTGDTGSLKNKKVHETNIEDLVEDGELMFEGYAKISVQRIIPKNKK